MYRGRVETYQAERRRQKASTPRCFICTEAVLYDRFAVGGRFTFRGESHVICERCRGRYHDPVGQASAFGDRFRFLEKSEVPMRKELAGLSTMRHAEYSKIFSILVLLGERHGNQEKEVNLMAVDETTKKILKLPNKVADIVSKTFVAMGDDAKITDDQALMMIRDLLEEIDPNIMTKKKRKRLS